MDYQQRHLVKMANQIAGSIPVRADVPEQICQHMRQFWTPVMQNRCGKSPPRPPIASVWTSTQRWKTSRD